MSVESIERFEATLDGGVEQGEPFTGFDEVQVLFDALTQLGLEPQLDFRGRGGYYCLLIQLDQRQIVLHVYLKKVTFGGRPSRPKEKRAQFSAGLDRTGFEIKQSEYEFTLMLGVYKREIFEDVVFCAWDVEDWGHNQGRAFNCFVDVEAIAYALKVGFSQHISSIGQISCCFRPANFILYLEHHSLLHKRIVGVDELDMLESLEKEVQAHYSELDPREEVPRYQHLFDYIINSLKELQGIASVDQMESAISDVLEISQKAKEVLHNPEESKRTELGYQLAWARYYLLRAGYIKKLRRGIWTLTEKGWLVELINRAEVIAIAKEDDINKDVQFDLFNNPGTEESDSEVEDEIADDPSQIDVPFDPNQVDIKTKSMAMYPLLKRMDRGEINTDTPFQRKAGLWDITKRSRLIESILIKFPLPAFYFDGTDDDEWLIVDGLQRLHTLHEFVNKGSFRLENLEFLGNIFNGKRFDELPAILQRRIEEFEVTAYIIAPGTPKKLKYIVFKRVNTGGLVLSAQEIRHALNQGIPAKFVAQLAELQSFKIATGFSINSNRMLDREFVTRFLAFYYTPYTDYQGNLESALNTAMEELLVLPESNRQSTRERFDCAMRLATSLFGDHAFRKRYQINDRRKPINKALFDTWSVLLAQLSEDDERVLEERKEQLEASFIRLMNEDNDFNLAISSATGDRARVRKRFEEIEKLIRSTIKG